MDRVVVENEKFIVEFIDGRYQCFIHETIWGVTMVLELTVRKLIRKKFLWWSYWGTEWEHAVDLNFFNKGLKYHHDTNDGIRYFYTDSLRHVVSRVIDDYHKRLDLLKKDADRTMDLRRTKVI